MVNTLDDMTVDVTAERAFARHLAYRLLDDMAAALLDGRTGTVAIPELDPEFGAIVGTFLGIIAQAVRSDRLPRDFLADTQTPPTIAGDKNSPDATNIEASTTKDQNNE